MEAKATERICSCKTHHHPLNIYCDECRENNPELVALGEKIRDTIFYGGVFEVGEKVNIARVSRKLAITVRDMMQAKINQPGGDKP